MKRPLETEHLPTNAVLVTCSSHERRCLGMAKILPDWRPRQVLIFHYTDRNERREQNHAELLRIFGLRTDIKEISFDERNPVASFRLRRAQLQELITAANEPDVRFVLDISVFTKRHLLMLLQWLDDHELWARTTVVYVEPEEYEIDSFIPLSFGVRSFEEIPGFPATPDPSRPLHAVIFLGFEGDRALATYELVEPVRTSLLLSSPSSQDHWETLAQEFNRDLISLVGAGAFYKVDPVDPEDTLHVLRSILGPEEERGDWSTLLCPLGTKAQALGCFEYVKRSNDPPAFMYTGPMRHNHEFFSRGIGNAWIIKDCLS